MSEVRIPAEPRTEFGKGAARRTRRANKVPAVLYGHGTPPRHLSLPGHETMLALKGGSNVLLELDLGEGSELALPKSVQRDPIRGFIEHVDLILVRRDEKVSVDVTITLVGESDASVLVTQQLNALPVEAPATSIPGGFEVDVSTLAVGDHLLASAIELPANVTLTGDPDAVVVNVQPAPTAEQLEEELAATTEDAPGAPSGEGDVVPDTESGEGGPSEPA